MGGTDAAQAFRSYNFDGSKDWLDYLKRVEIPDASDEVLLKLKAKWFIKNVDDSMSVAQLLGLAHSTQTQPQQRDSTAGESKSADADASGTRDHSRRTSTNAVPPYIAWRQRLLFALHMVIIASATLSLLPFFPRLTNRFYRVFLQANILACIMKVHATHGAPPFRPLSALKAWAMRAVPTTDFQYLIISCVFLSHPRTTLLLMPITVLAVYHAVAFADSQLHGLPLWQKHGVRLHRLLAQKQQAALVINAAAEVLLGCLLVVQLLTPARSLLLLYIYWNMLKLRYWSPDSRQYHQHVWKIVAAKAGPLVNRVPLLQKGVGFAQRWFHSGVQQ